MRGRYAAVVRTAGAGRLIGFGFMARLPDGMLNLAILLAVSRSTSLTVGGVAAGIYSASNAIGSPLRGRLVDRRGPTAVVLATGLGQSALLAALTAAVAAHERWSIFVAAAVAGSAAPPLTAVVRGVWMRSLESRTAFETAAALESVIGESVYLVGTVLAGTLGGAAPPAVVLLVTVGLRVVGCVGLATAPLTQRWRAVVAAQPRIAALRSSTLRAVLVVTILAFGGFGAIDVAVTHFTAARDESSYVGLLLAAYGIGSALGGAVQGTRSWRRSLEWQQACWLVGAALLLIPSIAVTSTWQLLAVLLVAGIPVAPSSTVAYLLVGRDATPGTDAEAYTWLTSAMFVGLSAGTSASGAVSSPFILAVAFCAAAALASLGLVCPRPRA